MSDPWITIGILFLSLVMLVGVGYYFYREYMKKQPPGIPCSRSGWQCVPGGVGIKEVAPDPTLVSPKDKKLYLAKFALAPGAGRPLCLPMWYCFRYVNVKTGGYSPFSEWTKLPVYSGAVKLPYPQGYNGPAGVQTCRYNQPVVGALSLDYPFSPDKTGRMIVANLHRYTATSETDITPPADPNTTNVKTEIVGYLAPYTSASGVKFAWADIMHHPCPNTCFKCSGC